MDGYKLLIKFQQPNEESLLQLGVLNLTLRGMIIFDY